jgi:DNA-binding NtrC family response regulator
VAIENALFYRQVLDEKSQLEKRLREVRSGSTDMIGRSEAMERLFQRIASVAASPMDVLVTGESGTGKELVARALHRSGRRASGKFIPLDCGSLSDTLVESELFGYRKGAFTGASESRPGLFEAAHGGILFLDEITNLSLKLQGKLLRVLQEREVRRLGETDPRKIDVQIIAATNRDLAEEARTGRFRNDLYYRLNSLEIQVPSLRERIGDIPLLIDSFLARAAESEGGREKVFSPEALQVLCDYHYPGNIRELKNVVQGCYYLTPGRVIGVEQLPLKVRGVKKSRPVSLEGREESLQIYRRIIKGEGTFEELVRIPFLKRQVGSPCIQEVMHLALQKANGRYREAFRLLKIPDQEYTTMMIFLRRHDCYLNYRLYRRKKSLE